MIEIQAPNGQVIEIDGNTMPSEAELDEIFKSTGTMGEPLTKSVMDAEDGKIYNVPMSMDGTDTNFNIQTQHKGMDKADFFGKVNFRFNPLEVQKDLIKRAKEGLEGKSLFDVAKVGLDTINKKTGDVTTPVVEKVGKNIAKAGVDFAGSVSNVAIDTFTGYQDLDKAVDNSEVPMSLIAGARVRADAFLNNTTYQESAKKLLESTKKLKEKNKKFFEQKSEKVLPSEEMDKFDKLLYGVSNGAASVGAAIGATLLTKNPTVGSAFTAGLFGSMQQSEYYDKSREAGFSAERSQFYGNIAGVINAGLEFVGDKALMSIGNVGGVKKITDNIAKATIEKLSANKATKSAAAKIASKHLNSVGKQALKGFASEFSEEASQTLAEDVLENLTDVSDMSFSDVLNDTLYAGFIGGLTGGLFGGASTAINNKTIKENNDKIKNLLSKISPDLNETELQATADVVQEMYFQEAANYQEQISDHIEKETDLDAMPEGLTKEQLLQKTRDSLKEKFGMTDEEIDQYAENALTAIDARNQYNEVFTGYRDALIEQGIDDNKASAAAQILSASALSLAIQNKTTAQEISKRRNLKFEREKFDKNKYNPQYKTEDGDFIPFQFAGEKAVGAELNKLQEAKQLSKKGLLSNEEIRKQTGWFKGKDGKWRFEISELEQFIELTEEYGLEYGSENQKKIEDRIKELEQKSGRNLDEYEFYKNLYGEIEARNTQARMNLSDEERLAKSPQSTQDVSDNDAIVVFSDGSTVSYNIYYQSSLSSKTRVKAREVKNALQEIANGAEEATVKDLRNDLDKYGGTNDVTFVYGNAKKGLFHIADKHGGMKTLLKVLDAVVDGNVARYTNTKKTVVVEKDGYEAVLSLDENGNKKTWLLTGWDTKISPDAEREFSATLKATQQEPTFSRQLLGAGLNDINLSPNSENVNSKVQNQGDESNPRGAYEIANHIIKLFEQADTSTLIHELGHFFLEELKDYGDTKQGAEMLSSVYDYLGVKDGAITKEQHELFADSFEKYILNGKAPNSTLAKCFQAFARWLRNLKFEVQRLGYVKLNDDIVKNFDKMLGGKAIDFAMQNSSLQMQEMFDSGVIPRHVIDKAIKLLEDGKISRSDLDDIVSKLRAGEMKNKEVFAELNRLEGLNIQHYEQLNPFDTMKYRQQLSNRNFEKSKVIEKIERLVEWSKPRMAGGKEVGRFPNKQLNDYFTNVRNLLALSKDDARAKIAENLDKLGTMFTSENAIDDSETRDALIFENKILSIPAKRTTGQGLIDVYNGLSESYNLGRLSDSITKRAKKERRDAMINDALQVITGHKTVSASIEQGKIKQFLNQLGTSQYSWQGILDVLSMNDKTSKSGQSVLSKMLDVFDAEQQEAKGIADDGEIFSEIAANKFASTNNSKIALSKYIDDELQKTITIEWGTHKKRFTKDQLIDIYMKSLDSETREIMVNDEINGFDNNFLNIVNQELTSDDFAFADALFEFYKQNYDKINPYYEDRFGISLGKRDYYSPRSMERTGTNLDTGDVISYAGFGNIKKRTVKKQGTLKIKGAFSTFNQYIVNSNHYLSWSEKLIDINAIFGNVEIKNAIRNIFGNQMLSRIDYEISRFASNDTFQKKFSLGVNFNKLRSNYAKSVLGLKPSLMIKQLTSFPAYLENMNSAEFISGVTDFFSNMKEAVDTLGNTTLMKTRGTNIIKDFAELSKLDVLKGKSGLKFSDAMMINIKLGDRGAIYIGGWALYKAELKKNLAKGMSNEQAKQKALETFERVTDETQQSGRMSQQSYWQSNPFLRAFTMFQSSQNQYFRKELNAIRGLATGRMDAQKAAKTIFIYHFLLPMLFQFASDGFDWDKDAQLRTAVIGSLNGVFVLSALLGKLYDAATTGSFSSGTMRVRDVIPFVGSIEDMNKFLVKLVEGEVEPDWSDFMDVLETFSKPLQTAGELSGLPLKYPLDVIKNFGRYAEDDEYNKEVLLWLGWSPYALRDKE